MSDNAVTQTGGHFQTTKPYKFFTYLLGAVLVLVASVITDGITQGEWTTVIISTSGAIVVWLTTNLPTFPKLKEISAIISTVANFLVAYLFGSGISSQDWVNLIILVLFTLGVIVVPNPVADRSQVRNRGLDK